MNSSEDTIANTYHPPRSKESLYVERVTFFWDEEILMMTKHYKDKSEFTEPVAKFEVLQDCIRDYSEKFGKELIENTISNESRARHALEYLKKVAEGKSLTYFKVKEAE